MSASGIFAMTQENRSSGFPTCDTRIQMGGGDGQDLPSEKPQNYRVPSQYWSGFLGTLQSYKASIQCWDSKTTFKWRFAGGPLLVEIGSFLPSSSKKKKKQQQNKRLSVELDPSDKTFWIRACAKFLIPINLLS